MSVSTCHGRSRDVRDEDRGQAGAQAGASTSRDVRRERPPRSPPFGSAGPLIRFSRGRRSPRTSTTGSARGVRRALRLPADGLDWGRGGRGVACGRRRNGTVPALGRCLTTPPRPRAVRLVRRNPFARLGISRGPGRRDEQPPSEEQVWKLIRLRARAGDTIVRCVAPGRGLLRSAAG